MEKHGAFMEKHGEFMEKHGEFMEKIWRIYGDVHGFSWNFLVFFAGLRDFSINHAVILMGITMVRTCIS